jgi:hypothetical protein
MELGWLPGSQRLALAGRPPDVVLGQGADLFALPLRLLGDALAFFRCASGIDARIAQHDDFWISSFLQLSHNASVTKVSLPGEEETERQGGSQYGERGTNTSRVQHLPPERAFVSTAKLLPYRTKGRHDDEKRELKLALHQSKAWPFVLSACASAWDGLGSFCAGRNRIATGASVVTTTTIPAAGLRPSTPCDEMHARLLRGERTKRFANKHARNFSHSMLREATAKDLEHSRAMKVVVLSISIGRQWLANLTRPRLRSYCERHGYSLRLSERSFDTTRHVSWSRIPFLLSVMRNEPSFDLYTWIDDDVYISALDRPISTLIAPYFYGDCDAATTIFVLSQDAVSFSPFNAGVLIVRRHADAAKTLQRVFDIGSRLRLAWQRDWEQTAMAHHYADGNAKAFCILPLTALQSFYRDYGMHPTAIWQPTHFAAHLSGFGEDGAEQVKLKRYAHCVDELTARHSSVDSTHART